MFPARSPRELRRLMKRMGLDFTELSDVEEVVIRLRDRELVITGAQVYRIRAQGQDMYQVLGGKTIEREREVEGVAGEERVSEEEFPEEDVLFVAEQAGVSPEEARRALAKTGGDLAEAILLLRSGS